MADGWVWLDHPDLEGGPVQFADNPVVLATQKARGWVQVPEPREEGTEAEPPTDVRPNRKKG